MNIKLLENLAAIATGLDWSKIYFGDSMATYQWLIMAAEALTAAEKDDDQDWYELVDYYLTKIRAFIRFERCLPTSLTLKKYAKESVDNTHVRVYTSRHEKAN
jgi:hypothetical protein